MTSTTTCGHNHGEVHPGAADAAPSSITQLRIYLHSELYVSHASHGVSHDDYSQYGSYCTRRLSRLRHGKSVKKELLHCRMYKSSLSTATIDAATDGGGGSGNKSSRHAYRAIDMTKLPSSVLASHMSYFLEPLYCAERCWAASMHAKSTNASSVDGASGGVGSGKKKSLTQGKIRALCIRRLRKAVKYATLLETLASSTVPSEVGVEENGKEIKEMLPVDDHTQMEVRAYACWMRGNLALEQSQWKIACIEYQSALTFCQSLASGGNDNKEVLTESQSDKKQQLELLDFFTTRAQNVIAPLLRYCQYELQEKEISTNEKISLLQSSSAHQAQQQLNSLKALSLQNEASTGSSMSQVVFRENNIVVETKELRMALLKIQDLTKDWEEEDKVKGEDAKFMNLLSGYDDAISLANQELKQLASVKSGPAVNAKKFQLMHVLGYAKYQKLKLVMGRNEDMVCNIIRKHGGTANNSGKGKKKEMSLKHLEEVAHLYDALLQDARAIAALPGGGSSTDFSDTNPAVVEDEFLLEANANILRLRSLRCYYLAQMHASAVVHKYSDALALLDQAENLANEAMEEIGACDKMEGGDELLQSLEKVLNEMKRERFRIVSIQFLSKSSFVSPPNSDKSLLERLYDYDVPTGQDAVATPALGFSSIANVPPRLEPMACKPSFFDVALNYVSEYPVRELEKAVEEHLSDKGVNSSSRGILGWFRR